MDGVTPSHGTALIASLLPQSFVHRFEDGLLRTFLLVLQNLTVALALAGFAFSFPLSVATVWTYLLAWESLF